MISWMMLNFPACEEYRALFVCPKIQSEHAQLWQYRIIWSHLPKHHHIKPNAIHFKERSLLHTIHCRVSRKPIKKNDIFKKGLFNSLHTFQYDFSCSYLKLSPGYTVRLLSFSSKRRNEYLGRQLWKMRFRSQSQLIWIPITPPCEVDTWTMQYWHAL